MRLMSVASLAPTRPRRRPFKSTRVRLASRPRSSTLASPKPPPLFTAGLVAAPETVGNLCSRSPAVVTPDFSMEALSMVTMGLADSVSSRRTREPVTMTSSIDSVASWSCSCAIAVCICNCDSEAVAAVANAKRTEFVSEEFDIFRLLNGYRSTVQRCACPTPSPTVYFYVEGVFSSRQMTKHLRRRYSHMAAIISRVQGISKLFVTSCCAKATSLPSVQQSLRPIRLARASHPGRMAECDELPEICDERSPFGGPGGGGMGTPCGSVQAGLARMPATGAPDNMSDERTMFGHEGYQPRKLASLVTRTANRPRRRPGGT